MIFSENRFTLFRIMLYSAASANAAVSLRLRSPQSRIAATTGTKLLPLGDDVGFICGHGAGSSIGQERMTNPFITGEM